MLLRDAAERKKLEKAWVQPNLHLTSFSIVDILKDVRRQHFPEVNHDIAFYFVDRGPLACIYIEDSTATIYIHQLLNHPDTPWELGSLICKHELLHIRIPGVQEGKKFNQHPPAFWAAEKAICPERNRAWAWVWINLDGCLRKRRTKERIDVLLNWRKVWNSPKLDAAECQRVWVWGKPEDEFAGW